MLELFQMESFNWMLKWFIWSLLVIISTSGKSVFASAVVQQLYNQVVTNNFESSWLSFEIVLASFFEVISVIFSCHYKVKFKRSHFNVIVEIFLINSISYRSCVLTAATRCKNRTRYVRNSIFDEYESFC